MMAVERLAAAPLAHPVPALGEVTAVTLRAEVVGAVGHGAPVTLAAAAAPDTAAQLHVRVAVATTVGL